MEKMANVRDVRPGAGLKDCDSNAAASGWAPAIRSRQIVCKTRSISSMFISPVLSSRHYRLFIRLDAFVSSRRYCSQLSLLVIARFGFLQKIRFKGAKL